jgi:hypothetical protein
MSLVKEYIEEQGGNAYTFGLNDGTTVLALLSEEPIIKIEPNIIEKIGLDEIKYMVKESIKRIVNNQK